MDNNDKKEKHRKLKLIIMIIIIIIIILLLITSCTSNFFGRIGGIYNNEGDYTIEPDDGTEEIILNKDLIFLKDKINFSLSDTNAKVLFTYHNINPKDFTCTTSDAEIATCYVQDNYIVINPKGMGSIDITLEAKVNGKIYRATTKATIKDVTRYIKLAGKSGKIIINKNNEVIIPFSLVRLDGDVKVKVSDNTIADAYIIGNSLKVVGKKAGKVKVTLQVTYKGKVYETTYNLEVTKENNDATLQELNLSKGNINYQKDQNKYYLSVPYEEDKITIDPLPSDSKAKVTYEFNGEKVNNLKDLPLKVGKNKVTIKVEAEDGTTNVYEIEIERNVEVKTNGYLESLRVSEGVLTPKFQKDITSYHVTVNSDVKNLDVTLKADKNVQNVTYKFNGEVVDSLDNLPLKDGDNVIEVEVTNKDGKKKTYTITVTKEKEEEDKVLRKVVLKNASNDKYTAYLEDGTIDIAYEILEYDKNTNSWYATNDYNLDEVVVTLDGEVLKVSKGKITIKPNKKDLNKTKKLEIKYQDSQDSKNIEFKMLDYYLRSSQNSYEFNMDTGGNIILENNFFTSDITVKKIENGIIIASDNGEIVITGADLSFSYVKDAGTEYLVINVKSTSTGSKQIQVSGKMFDQEINSFNISVEFITEYLVNIDANGGYFDAFTMVYNLKLNSNSELDLSVYSAKKVTDDACKVYELVGFSERKDALPTDKDVYLKDDIIKITRNMDLYAIYSDKVVDNPEEESEKWVYLEDVLLFHNKEYYQKYGVDKIIYPGAYGTYLMNFTNNTGSDIIINKIKIEEVKTICIEDKGCLNMGYKIASDNNYYYGSSKEYTILNQNSKETTNMNLEIPSNSRADILLSWEWVEVDDELDTLIGNSVTDLNNLYSILVGINFKTIPKCPKG